MRYIRKPLELEAVKLSPEMAKTFGATSPDAFLCTFDSGAQAIMEKKDLDRDFLPKPPRKSRAKPQPADSTLDAGSGEVATATPKRMPK